MNTHFDEQLHRYLGANDYNETMNAIEHVIRDGDGVRMFITQGQAVFVSRLDYEKMCDKLLAFKLPFEMSSCYYVCLPSQADNLFVVIFSTKPPLPMAEIKSLIPVLTCSDLKRVGQHIKNKLR